jgi:AraC-like DNA-binding protein
MDKPVLLLVNLNQCNTTSDVMRLLGRHFHFTCLSDADAIAENIRALAPQAICFEYDFPDIPRLAVLQETKLAYPSIPIVMVTSQHSEDLAVWAFRSRVWDYFTKPLPVAAIQECFRTILALPRKQQQDTPREFVIRQCSLPTDTRFQGSSLSRDARIVKSALGYVEENLHGKITQTEVAERCGVTSCQFSRIFKQVHGTTFQEYVLRRRMGQAIRLLQNPSASVTDVCYTVGFNDQSHFTRIFRRYIGVSPSAYRKNLENAHASLLPLAGSR